MQEPAILNQFLSNASNKRWRRSVREDSLLFKTFC